MSDWEAFKDIVRVSNRLEETLLDQHKRMTKKYGAHLPYHIRVKVASINVKMAENDRLLVMLARALVREEDREKKDGNQENTNPKFDAEHIEEA